MNISFFVSGNATRVIKSIQYSQKNNLGIEKKIKCILSDNMENKNLKKLCNENSIKLIEFNARDFNYNQNKHTLSNYILENLIELEIDYLFLFCKRLLAGKLLQVYENRIINFHPSLLPSFKGLNAIDQSLKAKSFLMGNTAHFIDANVDEGISIMQSIFFSGDFRKYDDVLDLQIPMLLQIIKWLDEKRLNINNGKCFIKNAKYDIEMFIPNLEIEILRRDYIDR